MTIEMTAEEYLVKSDNYTGFCLDCGFEVEGGIEPDAKNYICPKCNASNVYGMAALLIESFIEFK